MLKQASYAPSQESANRAKQAPTIADTLADIDGMVHEPARLAILTVLKACDAADFVFLRTATGLTGDNLSVQLTRLLNAGLVAIESVPNGRRTTTMVSLRDAGHQELERYWQQMELLRTQVRDAVMPNSAIAPGDAEPRLARG